MIDERSISSWLRNLPDDQTEPQPAASPCSPQQPGRRKRDDQGQQLVTPPRSDHDSYTKREEAYQIGEQTPKKRRLDKSYHDLDTTPRAGAAAPSSSAPSLSDTASSISRTSSDSPNKKMLSLNISDSGGYEMKALNVDQPPVPGAADLLRSIQDAGRSLDILPHDMEPVISEQVKARNSDVRNWRHSFQRQGDSVSKLPGRLPTFEEVEHIHRNAIKCQERRHDEYGWNYHVHLPLFESIFEDANGQCDNFASTSCMTARPHRQFKIPSSPAKMIDLCVYASPLERDDRWAARVRRFSRYSPTQTVNHTDFEFISDLPLLLRIETKRPGVHWDKAQLQMGLWHAAQWSFEWAFGKKLARQGTDEKEADEADGIRKEDEEDEDDMEEMTARERWIKKRKGVVLSRLGFLPVIIIQGHRWHLVLSTYDSKTRKTTLWTDHQFGTTQRHLEIYSTIAGLRRLTAWARDVYLPWFEANVI